MAVDYTHEYSNYPEQIMDIKEFEDITDLDASIINQIKELQAKGNYAEASSYITKYSSQLENKIITNKVLNKLFEEVRNTQIKAIQSSQYIYTDTEEPLIAQLGDVWIGGD